MPMWRRKLGRKILYQRVFYVRMQIYVYFLMFLPQEPRCWGRCIRRTTWDIGVPVHELGTISMNWIATSSFSNAYIVRLPLHEMRGYGSVFSVVTQRVWNEPILQIHLAPSFLLFRKLWKNFLLKWSVDVWNHLEKKDRFKWRDISDSLKLLCRTGGNYSWG